MRKLDARPIQTFTYHRIAFRIDQNIFKLQICQMEPVTEKNMWVWLRVPELIFYLDDSLEYIDGIEKSLKGEENPIQNRDLLEKRKKK